VVEAGDLGRLRIQMVLLGRNQRFLKGELRHTSPLRSSSCRYRREFVGMVIRTASHDRIEPIKPEAMRGARPQKVW
jgi:hypothetical protein